MIAIFLYGKRRILAAKLPRMANNTARIAEIDSILAAGVSSTSVEGQSVTFDLEALRRERARLVAQDDAQKNRKSMLLGCDLGGR